MIKIILFWIRYNEHLNNLVSFSNVIYIRHNIILLLLLIRFTNKEMQIIHVPSFLGFVPTAVEI